MRTNTSRSSATAGAKRSFHCWSQTLKVVEEVEKYYFTHEKDNSMSVFSTVGSGPGGNGQNVARMFVRLKDWDERDTTTGTSFAIIECATKAFNKIKEIKEINSPLSPLPSGHVVGAVGSSPKRHTARGELSDFEKLWEAWPVKKGRAPAQRLYCRLARLGRLPSANALLTKVADLKARDAHWRNGYVKELGNWLRAEGWNDEPFLRPDKSSFSSTAGAMPPAPAEDSKQKNPDDPILEDKPSAPMRRETVLAIAAKSFCPWSRDEINAMLERADEFYQGQKKGDGESRVPGQQAAHPGTDGARILFHHDLCGTERERAHDNQLRAVLALSVRDEVRSPFFSFGVPFSVSGLACAPRFGPA